MCPSVSIRKTSELLTTSLPSLSHGYLTALQCLLLSTLATLFHNFVPSCEMIPSFWTILLSAPAFSERLLYPLRHHSNYLFFEVWHGPQSPRLSMPLSLVPQHCLHLPTLHFLISHTVSNRAYTIPVPPRDIETHWGRLRLILSPVISPVLMSKTLNTCYWMNELTALT